MPSATKGHMAKGEKSSIALAAQTGEVDALHLETSSRILSILERYKLGNRASAETCRQGESKFLAQVYTMVEADEAIIMCLPAFPFKSPNTTSKVLGRLPDKAEEFSLAHLNGLCTAIGDIYTPGAKLMIVSDGLVYNGVPDRDVWAYGEALRSLSAQEGFDHIDFCRLGDLVDIDLPHELDEITYVSNATNFRHALLNQFSKPGFNPSLRISEDEDTCLTYRGYIKFLETDLRYVYPVGETRSKSRYKRGIEYIAKQMLSRGDAFARAVRETFDKRLRLSIHPSTGENKLSISLLPTDAIFTTPWHCSIAFRLDGAVTTGHRSKFDADDDFEVVHESGRPSYYRERTNMLSWAQGKGGVTCTPLYPAGWMIRPALGPGRLAMGDIDTAKVRAMAELSSPIVLRGFSGTRERESFIEKAEEFSTPTPWKSGLVLEVKDRGADARGLNNVLSAERMPFHYDGLFKTERRVEDDGSETLVSLPPRFQLFTAVTASPKDAGFTIFASSSMIFRYLPKHVPLQYLRRLTWSVSTSSFNSTNIRGLPLVVDHPSTKAPCLRYHEPWPQSKTTFQATNVTIDNAGPDVNVDSETVCDALNSVLHDRRIAYYHAWEKGDLLVSDNTLTMHTRSDFPAGCDRELWRIHFD